MRASSPAYRDLHEVDERRSADVPHIPPSGSFK